MDFLNNKNFIIALSVFIVVVIFVLGLILYFNHADLNKTNPSVKKVLAIIPGFNNRLKQAEQMNEVQRQQKLIEEEKNKLKAEWDNIEKKNQELKVKEQELNNREQELKSKESELLATRAKLETNLKNIKDISQYYELMDPGNAAKIFATMDDELIIQIFQNMKKESVSQILSALDPKKAASITKKMSGI
ncbi:MAG: flagellar protein FlbB [Thermoanaerobacteraceae bacterium]|jgi:flagellar motility protein MotE (MotC chaperone)|nr:flagellar protein FlbB [Thermoanaerobacteraceae bacterium]MDN5312979.1 flagellar protein FlbB [Thermoanaerobacteraceae bacterium]RKL62923.1 magnesium transporter MgtE [Thermoanaerobacteraceae bacterium SP2]